MEIIENLLKMKLKALWAWQLKVGLAMYVGVVMFVITLPPPPKVWLSFKSPKNTKKLHSTLLVAKNDENTTFQS